MVLRNTTCRDLAKPHFACASMLSMSTPYPPWSIEPQRTQRDSQRAQSKCVRFFHGQVRRRHNTPKMTKKNYFATDDFLLKKYILRNADPSLHCTLMSLTNKQIKESKDRGAGDCIRQRTHLPIRKRLADQAQFVSVSGTPPSKN